MEQFLYRFADKTYFPKEAVPNLIEAYQNLCYYPQSHEAFMKLTEAYKENETEISFQSELHTIAEQIHSDCRTIDLLFFMVCAKWLEIRYAQANIENQLFWDLMCDFRFKLIECHKMYNVWGIFTFDWFRRHFLMERFALGRFQYEKANLRIENPVTVGNITLQPNQTVYNFHIPSSGKSLSKETRYDSYRRAKEFFCKDAPYVVLTCSSWLLYPEYRKVYPENSNLMAFMNDFTPISTSIYQEFSAAWRVFYKEYHGSTEGFPTETTLQRNFKKWLDNGGSHGAGYGFIIFDGNQIIR